MSQMISAICVSHSSRFGLLQRAVMNFMSQQYPNKELIIVVSEEGYLDQVRSFLARPEMTQSSVSANMRVYLQKFRQPAEALAHAMAWADGSVIAAWDDDNLSHPQRLGWQLEQTNTVLPTFLAQSLYYFYDSDELFVTDYSQPSGTPAERCAVSSLMFYRKAYQPLDGQSRGQWASAFMDKLAPARNYALISGDPAMFLVGSNGDNSRTAATHRRLGSMLPGTAKRESLIQNRHVLEEKLRGYECWPSATVDVCGKDAQAFQITDVAVWPAWLASTSPPEDWKAGIPSRELSQRLQAEQQVNRSVATTH